MKSWKLKAMFYLWFTFNKKPFISCFFINKKPNLDLFRLLRLPLPVLRSNQIWWHLTSSGARKSISEEKTKPIIRTADLCNPRSKTKYILPTAILKPWQNKKCQTFCGLLAKWLFFINCCLLCFKGGLISEILLYP